MTGFAGRTAIVALFAIAMGHLIWQTFGAPNEPEYVVGGNVTALSAVGTDNRHLYLRRTFFASEQPRHAWIQVLARDRVKVYVNGNLIGEKVEDGFDVAVVADMARNLRVGRNVVAIETERASVGQPSIGQSSVGQQPIVSIDGAIALGNDEIRLRSDSAWRCNDTFDRTAHWWFETDFDDHHWPVARRTEIRLRAPISQPPAAITSQSFARWISPTVHENADSAVRREFEIAGNPQQAWLRLTTDLSYRLAINGVVIDTQELRLGTTQPAPPIQRTYDITRFVQRGNNVVAISATTAAGPAHLLADIDIKDEFQQHYRINTDSQWLCGPPRRTEWLNPAGHVPSGWEPCTVTLGDLGIPPWRPRREYVALQRPAAHVAWDAVQQTVLTLAMGLLTLFLCWLAQRCLALPTKGIDSEIRSIAAYAALIPVTVAIGVAVIATYDQRIARQEIYQPLSVLLAAAALLVQWAILFLSVTSPRPLTASTSDSADKWSIVGRVSLLAAFVTIGCAFRFHQIATKPLHHDEVSVYLNTMGFLERGFPSREIHESLPIKYVETSELLFVGTAAAALVFDEDRYIVRFPAVCWGTLTILLVYGVGRRLFGTSVGLIAAALYAFAPICIQMSAFGRYFSQLQFLTLLTVYLFWRTIRGTGLIDRCALCWTSISFVAAYLTWEAVALIAPGMVVAALVQRRRRIRTVVLDPAVWLAIAAVLVVIAVQSTHRSLQLTQYLKFGVGISNLSLTQMWRYPTFNLWYAVWQSSWNRDALLPLFGLLGAGILTIRHPLRHPIRALLLIYLTTCFVHTLLLPSNSWRYTYHLIPLVILLSSAALSVGIEGLLAVRSQVSFPPFWRVYRRGVALFTAAAIVAVGSGMTLQLTELSSFHIPSYRLGYLTFPDLTASARYLKRHMRDDDLLLASDPHLIDHLLGGRYTEFWPQSSLKRPVLLDDERSAPLHRRTATEMVYGRENVEQLFTNNRRVWFVLVPSSYTNKNSADTSVFLRQNMDVCYEDFSSLVLFRGNQHRSAAMRQRGEASLNNARNNPFK